MSKTATNICALEAGDLTSLPHNTVLISINEEDELYPLKLDREDSRILTVRMSDVTAKKEMPDGRVYLPISLYTSHELLKFMEDNKDQNFIVHCAAGISRSGAVCLYLHHTYGHALKPRFWQTSCPNKYILGSLLFAKYEQTPSWRA